MAKKEIKSSLKFESANIDSAYNILDGIAWLDEPSIKDISQFSGVDPRTAGKVIKNCVQIGIVKEVTKDFYSLAVAYPYKGSKDQKKAVLKEAIFKMPLITSYTQFIKLGDNLENALRKAATVQKIENYDKSALDPLIKWATQLDAISIQLTSEDFVEEGIKHKDVRHREQKTSKVVFISHSSKDKPFIRQLSADLENENVLVWLDEQQIKVGDSISDKISQGLAESDYFIIALSESSINSEWVKKVYISVKVSTLFHSKLSSPIRAFSC